MKQEPPKQEEVGYVCLVCEDRPGFSGGAAFSEHCRAEHPEVVGPDGKIPIKKQMTSHMDAADWHATEYRLSTPGGRDLAVMAVRCERSPQDKAIWGEGE